MALLRIAVLGAPAVVAVVLLVLPARSSAAEGLSLGKSAITLDIDGTAIEAFTYKPPNWPGQRMLLVLHGAGRNAEEYRDDAVGMGDRFGALIVAPHFDDERFPSSRYQRGGVLRENGSAAPANEWTYSLIPKLAHAVREREDQPDLRFWIIGHSAGGQFSMRMSAFVATGAERIVAANPGSALLPRRDLPWGYGFGGLPDSLSNDEMLKRYLSAPLTVYVGTADDRPDDDFDTSQDAMAQGAGRRQRALAALAAASQLAAERGWALAWRLVEAQDVGHDHQQMFDNPRCEAALFGDR